jgi:hypothetical protein
VVIPENVGDEAGDFLPVKMTMRRAQVWNDGASD